jgi:hypothetical protein
MKMYTTWRLCACTTNVKHSVSQKFIALDITLHLQSLTFNVCDE